MAPQALLGLQGCRELQGLREPQGQREQTQLLPARQGQQAQLGPQALRLLLQVRQGRLVLRAPLGLTLPSLAQLGQPGQLGQLGQLGRQERKVFRAPQAPLVRQAPPDLPGLIPLSPDPRGLQDLLGPRGMLAPPGQQGLRARRV